MMEGERYHRRDVLCSGGLLITVGIAGCLSTGTGERIGTPTPSDDGDSNQDERTATKPSTDPGQSNNPPDKIPIDVDDPEYITWVNGYFAITGSVPDEIHLVNPVEPDDKGIINLPDQFSSDNFGNHRPKGIAWDGTTFWISTSNDKIVRVSFEGDMIEKFSPFGGSIYSPYGLTLVSSYMWIISNGGVINKFDYGEPIVRTDTTSQSDVSLNASENMKMINEIVDKSDSAGFKKSFDLFDIQSDRLGGIDWSDGYLWVANRDEGIFQIDPEKEEIVDEISYDPEGVIYDGPSGVTWAVGSLWAFGESDSYIHRIM